MESISYVGSHLRRLREKAKKLWNAKMIKYFICMITPFALLPLALSPRKEAKCGYVILWMIIYWILEPVNLTVTALLPVPLMPLLGILDTKEVAPNYMKEVLMMFLGGLGIAVAVEYCNLHKRVALKVLLTIGTAKKWLMFGFMFTTMFLSMWISNSATTAMMVPIIEAVMKELKINEDDDADENDTKVLHKTLLISVAYSANLGGTGTFAGTAPNMIFYGFMEDLYAGSSEITYASWMAYNIPGMILVVLAAWLLLQSLYVPCWRKQQEETKEKMQSVIRSRYEELGRMTFHEAGVLGLFLLLVGLWVFREPKFMPGWVDALASEKQVGDAVPAIGVLFLMFLLPAEPRKLYTSPPLVTWEIMQQKLPWGLVLLLGGGLAMANGAEKSGLSKLLGQEMTQLFVYSPTIVLVILLIFTITLTQFMSNTVTTTLVLPVMNQMATSANVNPLYFMLPVTIGASYAFVLPVASGPTAIIFGSGHMKTLDMVKPGIIMCVFALIVQLFMIHTLGNHMFNLDTFPSWANVTTIINSTIDDTS